MGPGKERVERGLDVAAAALLAGAAGFAAYELASRSVALTAAAAALVFAVSLWLLRMVAPEPQLFDLAGFAVRTLDFDEPDELLLTEQVELILTDADRLRPDGSHGELILDDILEQLGPQSRVVRLFDRAAMPTPGQLSSRIERHLERERDTAPADASEALYDALAELRRSLR